MKGRFSDSSGCASQNEKPLEYFMLCFSHYNQKDITQIHKFVFRVTFKKSATIKLLYPTKEVIFCKNYAFCLTQNIASPKTPC